MMSKEDVNQRNLNKEELNLLNMIKEEGSQYNLIHQQEETKLDKFNGLNPKSYNQSLAEKVKIQNKEDHIQENVSICNTTNLHISHINHHLEADNLIQF